MNNYRKRVLWFLIILVVAVFATGIIVYPHLPVSVISHWGSQGQPNGTLSRFWGDFLLPVVMLILVLFWAFLPKIDPFGKNIETFRKEYDLFWIILIAFLAYTYALTLGANFGWKVNISAALLTGIAFLFYAIGAILPYTKRSWVFGIRSPWTLSSELVWEKTHRLGSILFECAALVIAVGVLFPSHWWAYFVLIPIIAAALISVVASYFFYRKEKHRT